MTTQHLYALEFAAFEPVIKIGRAQDPERRIAQHAERGEVFGVRIVRQHIAACAGDALAAEANLIERCASQAIERRAFEWFVGLGFEWVREQTDLAAADVYPERTSAARAIQAAGSQTELARRIGVTKQFVSHWATGRRAVPAEYCPAIERATGGAVRCEDLRPDIDWAVLRGLPLVTKEAA